MQQLQPMFDIQETAEQGIQTVQLLDLQIGACLHSEGGDPGRSQLDKNHVSRRCSYLLIKRP